MKLLKQIGFIFIAGLVSAAPNVHLRDIEEIPNLFEGDIVRRPHNKNGMIDEKFMWPGGLVVYELDPTFTTSDRLRIFAGWDDILNTTCIKFRARQTGDVDYVYVQNGPVDSGCYSEVGKIGGRQVLNLEPRCVDRHGTITHEMLHALGFYHEQSRPDRDDFVTVVWDKIEPGLEDNFEKYNTSEVSTFGAPYDYGSVLHYPKTGFSIDGSPTLIPKVENYQYPCHVIEIPGVEIGQRIKISQIDAGKVRLMYHCP